MKRRLFGTTKDNKEVYAYSLTDGKITAEIIDLGGTIISLNVPKKDGEMVDVLLGYSKVSDYENYGGYLGALIGRVGNRIANAQFTLNGKTYNIFKNDNNVTLHGGKVGFDKKIWTVKEATDNTLLLSYLSVDGEENYPGNLTVEVKYTVENGGLSLEYFAETDSDTIINLTNHAYFNLDGENSGDILSTLVKMDSDYITPVDSDLVPNDEMMDVTGTPFDYRQFKTIGEGVNGNHEQIRLGGGIDHNFAINTNGEFKKVIECVGQKTDIKMSVYTDQPGVQFYSGNFLDGAIGKSGTQYFKRYGFCLETQHYPNSINCPSYPTTVLKKGDKFYSKTTYKFD